VLLGLGVGGVFTLGKLAMSGLMRIVAWDSAASGRQHPGLIGAFKQDLVSLGGRGPGFLS
jgi:hypothetical protein